MSHPLLCMSPGIRTLRQGPILFLARHTVGRIEEPLVAATAASAVVGSVASRQSSRGHDSVSSIPVNILLDPGELYFTVIRPHVSIFICGIPVGVQVVSSEVLFCSRGCAPVDKDVSIVT